MIKNIVKDIEFLKNISEDMTQDDKYIIDDLNDTLLFNKSRCVGMAANMIGYLKNAIIFEDNKKNYQIMINPKIIKKEEKYEAEEGCLSLDGTRKTIRYKKIKVEYLDALYRKRIKTFTDFEAQIIQHEIDHLFGIII
jgi:peptide deformylase